MKHGNRGYFFFVVRVELILLGDILFHEDQTTSPYKKNHSDWNKASLGNFSQVKDDNATSFISPKPEKSLGLFNCCMKLTSLDELLNLQVLHPNDEGMYAFIAFLQYRHF